MSVRNHDQRSKMLILSLGIPLIILLLVFGLLFPGFELLIFVGIPIAVLIVIGVIFIKFSWNPQHYCSRCNYPVSIYAEFCRNCGLKLITRCPNCDNYIKEGISHCNKCGYALESLEQLGGTEAYEKFENGSQIPSRPNYCPTCGANLRNVKNIRFCEYCGSRIK